MTLQELKRTVDEMLQADPYRAEMTVAFRSSDRLFAGPRLARSSEVARVGGLATFVLYDTETPA